MPFLFASRRHRERKKKEEDDERERGGSVKGERERERERRWWREGRSGGTRRRGGPGDEQSDRRVEAAKGWRSPSLSHLLPSSRTHFARVNSGWWDLHPQGEEEAGVGRGRGQHTVEGRRTGGHRARRLAKKSRERERGGGGPSYRVV